MRLTRTARPERSSCSRSALALRLDKAREAVTVPQGDVPSSGVIVERFKVATFIELSTAIASPGEGHVGFMSDQGEDSLFSKVEGEGCKAKHGDEAICSNGSFHGADGEAGQPVNLRKM